MPFSRGRLGELDSAVAAMVIAASGDIAMVVDRDGVIRDMALSNDEMVRDGARTWLDQRWADTVTVESRHKVDDLLRDALIGGHSQWREINQVTPNVNAMMMKFITVDAGRDGQVIAIGRDDRMTWVMQQRLVEAQQAVERDYSRLRDAESRYRLLFQMSGEAVVIVDAGSKKIIDANPVAETLFKSDGAKLVGQVFAKLFDNGDQDEAASLLTLVQPLTRTNCSQARLSSRNRPFIVSVSRFRHDRSTHCLVRLTPVDRDAETTGEPERRLRAVVEKMPDAFLVTDGALKILATNTAFLDLVGIATKEEVVGQSLNQFLGREGLERNILLDNLRDHGSVRNFSTHLRNHYDYEDVEVSAVAVADGAQAFSGFTIRSVRRRQRERSQSAPDMRRSVEQLTELVGRVKMKELVSETTDLVERLCIEAALELTKGNRASAAEVLGLSRQSLYSKLHRFGLGNLTDNEN